MSVCSGGTLMLGGVTICVGGVAVGTAEVTIGTTTVAVSSCSLGKDIKQMMEAKSGGGGNKPDSTKHSTYRKDVTGRPTGTVVNDIQTARPKDILIEDNGNIIVRGSNGRVQVLSPDGQRHITTLTRTDANVKSLINQGRYRYSSYEEAENIINMYKK